MRAIMPSTFYCFLPNRRKKERIIPAILNGVKNLFALFADSLKQEFSFSSNNFSPSILVLFKKDVIFVVSNFFPQEQ